MRTWLGMMFRGGDGNDKQVSAATPMPSSDADTQARLDTANALLGAIDAGEREYTPVPVLVEAAGDTPIYTPAAGKRVRIWWVYALNDPASITPRLITLKIGSVVKSMTYGISKRQKITGGVDESVIINLSGAGSVAVTILLEEID